ncbi:aldo/keto reductase [Desertivirga arenae]|uniref:aldo/keto reductase n=1 Tax=Desertivirga arenae TaxID=2810309 RepID=UPI001A966EE7|nr:aldo/keto reductase [Pedobacter sp. SYSU D00823]
MQHRKISNSDLELSAITFGSWAAGGWMWGGTEKAEAIEAIRSAFTEGVTSIDTAPVYGQGLSEEIVGEAIKGLPRDRVQILTKYGLRWDAPIGEFYFKSKNNQGQDIDIYRYAGKDHIIKECETSLKLLGTDYIDLYQIHWPDPTTPIEETMEAISTLIQQGKVRYAGVCNYSDEQLKLANSVLNIVSNQIPYSMVNRKIEEVVLPYCLANNKSILAYSPLERGLLTGKIKPGHQFSEGDHRASHKFFQDENIKRINIFLDKIQPLADDKGVTLGQLVLRWTVERPGITVALVGARNAVQAVENAKTMSFSLSQEEYSLITTALADLELAI